MPISLTQENFEKEVLHAKKPVVVDVYASWCGPCQHMAPFFDELSNEMSNIYVFAKLNVDTARELSMQFGVTSIPTFLFFKNGALIAKETGSMSKEALKEKIVAHCA